MSIAAKHTYRFKYLRSDAWKDFRSKALSAFGSECFLCGESFRTPDIHHLWYPGEKEAGIEDVRPLCRTCHDLAHSCTTPSKYRSREEALSAFNNWFWEAKRCISTVPTRLEEIAARKRAIRRAMLSLEMEFDNLCKIESALLSTHKARSVKMPKVGKRGPIRATVWNAIVKMFYRDDASINENLKIYAAKLLDDGRVTAYSGN